MRTDFYIQGIHFYKSVDEKNNETWKLLRLKIIISSQFPLPILKICYLSRIVPVLHLVCKLNQQLLFYFITSESVLSQLYGNT